MPNAKRTHHAERLPVEHPAPQTQDHHNCCSTIHHQHNKPKVYLRPSLSPATLPYRPSWHPQRAELSPNYYTFPPKFPTNPIPSGASALHPSSFQCLIPFLSSALSSIPYFPPMQGQPFHQNPNTRPPYSQWSQHRAANGLIYLSHPHTKEVKWLWSRHHDPKTSSDYLVNTITGDRQWVTKLNEHLCPSRTHTPLTVPPSQSSTPTNPFSPKAGAASPRPASVKQPTNPSPSANFREIEAPKSLGLTADEILMLVPGTGRRYIYNRKTKSSRWLPANSFASPLDPPILTHPQSLPRPTANTAAEVIPVRPSPPQNSAPYAPPTPIPTRPQSLLRPVANAAPNSIPVRLFPPQNAVPTTPPQSSAQYPQRGSPVHKRHDMNGYNAFRLSLGSDEAVVRIQRVLRGVMIRKADVIGKLRVLNNIMGNIKHVTGAGKYDLEELRRLARGRVRTDERQDAAQRLLELGEVLTQTMLKLDDVTSAGIQFVRMKRKQCVNHIVNLTEEVDGLGKRLKGNER